MSAAVKAKWRFWRPSIALRLTVWYALSALALILLATGFLYWVLVTNLEREDRRVLTDNLNNIRLLIHSAPSGALLLQAEGAPTWPQPPAPQIYFRVFDKDARLLVETPGMSEELPTPSVTDLAALLAPEGLSRELVSRSGKLFQTVTAPVNENRVLPSRFIEVAIDRANEEHVLDQYRERLWFVLSLSVFVCALVGYLIARSGMRPIESIGRTAEQIHSATLHERIAIAGLPAELSGLAATFNSMLDRLEDSFTRISQFSDDVAHELRTPISNLRGELEVALSKARPVEDYRDILGSSLEECARISRVIQSLLFLARTENAGDWLARDAVDVGKELRAVQEFYGAAAAEAGVDLCISVPTNFLVPLDRTLFQQAVGNLVSNGIAHTPEGGVVQITASARGAWLHLEVSDTGCGIPAEHLPHVLDRFYRVDRARSGSRQNVGLGLALVKASSPATEGKWKSIVMRATARACPSCFHEVTVSKLDSNNPRSSFRQVLTRLNRRRTGYRLPAVPAFLPPPEAFKMTIPSSELHGRVSRKSYAPVTTQVAPGSRQRQQDLRDASNAENNLYRRDHHDSRGLRALPDRADITHG